MDYSITTHNGEITMENPETGKHRTIRIRTQKNNSNFRPGERIAYLLNGSNNDHDYLPFAFVKNGLVLVWRRYRGNGQPSSYDKLATMITNPARFEERGIRYLFSISCRRCNRTLTTPESIRRGLGEKCATKE